MTTGWLGASQIGAVSRYWPGAVDLDADELDALLTSSAIQCDAYAPKLTFTDTNGDGTTTEWEDYAPENYLHGQVLQARALYRAMIAGDNNGIGADGFTVTVFPMDWTVKNLLRPKKGGLWVR